MYFLGVDVGTSKIKAALIDLEGKQIDIESMPVKILHPFEGACEIDMNELWHSFCSLTKALAKRNTHIWEGVIGVGVTGQGDGLWAIDKSGNPVRNAILWNDTRTKNLDIRNREEIDEICIKNSTNVVYAGAWHILLRWLKEFERDKFNCISSLLHCKDWMNFKLTGEIATDYSDASTALFNVHEKKYSFEVLDALGLGDKAHLYPKPVPSTTIIGEISKKASIESGLKEGIKVIAGSIDVAAVALGLGVKETGDACTIIGTTLCNEIVLDNPSDFNNNMVVCHIPKGKYMNVMPTLNGTSTIDWVKNILFPDISFKEMNDRLNSVPLGSRGIFFQPYLYGERAPFRNPFATGSFCGLSAIHTKIDMCRSAYEGLALTLYECYQLLPQIYDSIRVSGGGSKSEFLCQMISDSLGKAVIRPKVQELGVSGIVIAVKYGMGYINDFSQIDPKDDIVFTSNKNNHEKYIELFDTFRELRFNMEDFWAKRGRI